MRMSRFSPRLPASRPWSLWRSSAVSLSLPEICSVSWAMYFALFAENPNLTAQPPELLSLLAADALGLTSINGLLL